MEAHVLRIVSRGKTPATGRLEHLPKLWLHAPVRFELACAAPEDTEAALDGTPTYSISIHSLDASRNPVDSPLVWYAEVDAEGNTDKSKGPHAVFELSAADIANVTEAGEYWLAFHAYSGGERIVRAAGYLTFADDGFPTDPPTPTPPGTVYLTQAAGDARYVRDPGTVVDNRLVRWDGTSGNQVQSSLVTVNDDGNVSTPGSVSASSLQVAGTFQADMYVDDLSADRTHALPNADGTYALTGETDGKVKLIDLKDVTITTPSTGHVLTWNGTIWVNAAPSGGGGGGGSVTITGQDGIGVSGSPGTSITLSLGAITPDALTVAGATEFRGAVLFTSTVDSAFSVEVSADNITEGGGQLYLPTTSGLTLAVVGNPDGVIRASDIYDGTTVGRNIFKLTNPGAITFLRMNADNTVTARSALDFRSDLGLGALATLGQVDTAQIAGNAVSNGNLAEVAPSTFKGNPTTGTVQSPEDMTPAQAAAILPVMTPSLKGLAPSSGGGTVSFLRADATFAQAVVAGSVDNAVVRADGTGGATTQGSAIVIDDATTATASNVAILVNHAGQTNSSLVLTPQGTGAFILGPKPDGLSTGGDARGVRALDLQRSRSLPSHIASNTDSALIGGGNNTASGHRSGVFCGESNTSSAAQSVCLAGQQNVASATQAVTLGGTGARANRIGMQAQANGLISNAGDMQRGVLVMRRTTTDATPVQLSLNGAAPTGASITTSTHFILLDNQAVFADIRVVARSTGGTDHAAFMRRVLIKRDANAASTAIIGSVLSPTTDIKSAGATAWDVTITALATATEGGMLVTVTGAATTINWVASVEFVETTRA